MCYVEQETTCKPKALQYFSYYTKPIKFYTIKFHMWVYEILNPETPNKILSEAQQAI